MPGIAVSGAQQCLRADNTRTDRGGGDRRHPSPPPPQSRLMDIDELADTIFEGIAHSHQPPSRITWDDAAHAAEFIISHVANTIEPSDP